jgi:hypothetical protein
MRLRTLCAMAGMTALLWMVGGGGLAGEKKKDPFAEYLEKFGTPGPEHKMLKSMTGTWTAKVKFYMEPGKPPTESTGKTVRTMVMDGRYLQDKFDGEAFGKKFQGMGLTAYDRFKKQYSMTWIDSMGTGVSMNHGTYDEKTKTFTYRGPEEIDPISGMKMKTRDTLKIVSDNEQLMEMYRESGGKEFKVLEITYTRMTK